MRAFRFLNLGILAAMIASSAVLYAQDEKPQEDKPKQAEPKQAEPKPQNEARPASKQDEMKPPKQDEAKPARPDQAERKQDERQPREEMKPAQQEPARQEAGRPEPNRQEAAPRQENARPGGNGGRIPDDRFRAQFGREHHFAMQRPVVVSGRPQFQYGGYYFVLIDAWPPDWDYTDDCYIDYVDGEYFLFDLRHPEMRLALTVVM
jgi:hypothetical protein